jgi:uncharacterized protein
MVRDNSEKAERVRRIVWEMQVGSLYVEVHVPTSHSLKEKRSVVKHLVEGARSRFQVAASEVAHQETWQRAGLGFACVASSANHVSEVLDEVERFVWSHPEIEVLTVERNWMEE